MKRAPEVCPHWESGKHGDVRVAIWLRWRRRVVSVCPSCNGWWQEIETVREHKRKRKDPVNGVYDARKHQSYY
jgi:hypothetical protein